MSRSTTVLTRRPKRLLGIAAGLFAVIVPFELADAAPSEGYPFTSPSGEFSVVFPSEPGDMSEMLPSGVGVDAFEVYAAFGGGVLFMTVRLESFFPTGAEDQQDLEQLVEDFVRGMGGGEVTNSSLIEHRGMTGFEIAAITETAGRPASLYGRFYLTDTVGYMVFVLGERPSISMKDPDVAAFVDSFDFVKEAF